MKQYLVLCFSILLVAACSNNATTSDNKSTEVKTPADSAAKMNTETAMTPEQQKGLDLVAKSDCFTCHKINDASVGPAYMLVAQKYQAKPDVIDTLANKIIHGGSGNWGAVPMTPHPALSTEDAKSMVNYILSLKQ